MSLMMSSCCTLRLKRRNALSIDSLSCTLTSAKLSGHLPWAASVTIRMAPTVRQIGPGGPASALPSQSRPARPSGHATVCCPAPPFVPSDLVGRRYGHSRAQGRNRAAPRQAARRFGQNPRGQARGRLDGRTPSPPDRHPDARPGLHLLHGRHRDGRQSRHTLSLSEYNRKPGAPFAFACSAVWSR